MTTLKLTLHSLCLCVHAENFAENVLSFLTKIATAQKLILSTVWHVYTICTRDHKNEAPISANFLHYFLSENDDPTIEEWDTTATLCGCSFLFLSSAIL